MGTVPDITKTCVQAKGLGYVTHEMVTRKNEDGDKQKLNEFILQFL